MIVLAQWLLAWSPSYTANSGGIEQASEQSANLTHEWQQVPEVIGGGRVKAAKLHALHACQRGSSRGTRVVTAPPVHVIRLTDAREITLYVSMYPGEDR